MSDLTPVVANGRAAALGARDTGEREARAAGEEVAAERLKWSVAAYVAVVMAFAALCLGFFAPDVSMDRWQGLLTLIIVGIVFERVGIRIYGDTYVSAGVVPLFAIAILFGPAETAVAAPAVVALAMASSSSPWYGRLFDMSSYTVTNVVTALTFHAAINVDDGLNGWWLPVAMAAITLNFAMNSALVAGVASVRSGDQVLAVWRQEHRWLLPYYGVFGLLGLALAAGYLALGVPGILAFVAPPLMMRFALHQYLTKTEQTVLELKQKNAELEAANHNIMQMTQQLTETYDGTLEALVLALDARDRETKGHSFRVAKYVMAMARELGLEENSRELIDMQRGALLHDVGKIGVPDFILHKPGPLTPEEWDDMKRHPHIGFDMLKDIGFLTGAAAIVRTHHERFDGKGYPAGLRGAEIPLGSRIFSLADAFDAMTSDRPYRKAVPPEMARAEIIRHSGTQFDPKVVQMFLLVYDQLEKGALEDRHEEAARAA